MSIQRVVLLHGLMRRAGSMKLLTQHLRRSGFEPENTGYPSRRVSVIDLAEQTLTPLLSDGRPAHFVTHSMGGILLRAWAARHGSDQIARAVMLGPPNQGSQVIDRFRGRLLFEWLIGPAGCQLGCRVEDVPNQLGPVAFDAGVIAGTRRLPVIPRKLVPEPSDGLVSVASTRVIGMRDHRAMPVNHTFMMRNPQVMDEVVQFLRHGQFRPIETPEETTAP